MHLSPPNEPDTGGGDGPDTGGPRPSPADPVAGPGGPRPVDPAVIGDRPTTFGAEPWWSDRGWTRLPQAGRPTGAVIENGVAGPFAVCGGSIRGRRHQLAGEPNDDAFEIATLCDEAGDVVWLIIAVCDGVGSAPHSSIGARLAASHAVALIALSLRSRLSIEIGRYTDALRRQGPEFLKRLTRGVRDDVDHRAAQPLTLMPNRPAPGTPLVELQTTLSLVGLRAAPGPEGGHDGFFARVGDSPVFRVSGDMFEPVTQVADTSGTWSTATEGVLGATELDVQPLHIGPDEALMVATDGVGNFVQHDQSLTALGRYLHDRWSSPLDSVSFLRDLSFDLTSADDDRTAVLVWPRV